MTISSPLVRAHNAKSESGVMDVSIKVIFGFGELARLTD
jgi:hypothetical protein